MSNCTATGIGQKIRELRLAKDLTLDTLSKELYKHFGVDINNSCISRWENGINEPSLIYLKYLAQYFNVSADYLIGKEVNQVAYSIGGHTYGVIGGDEIIKEFQK